MNDNQTISQYVGSFTRLFEGPEVDERLKKLVITSYLVSNYTFTLSGENATNTTCILHCILYVVNDGQIFSIYKRNKPIILELVGPLVAFTDGLSKQIRILVVKYNRLNFCRAKKKIF